MQKPQKVAPLSSAADEGVMRNKMRKIFILISISFSPILMAQNLCDKWDNKIANDMRMPESIFNHKNSESSNKFLLNVRNGIIKEYQWYEPLNAEKIIKGYSLKSKAIKSENAIDDYCNFIVKEAFYHD